MRHTGGHSNLVPQLGTFQAGASGRRWLLHPLAPHSLADALRCSKQGGRAPEDPPARLLLYHLLSALRELHAGGAYHGRLMPEHVLLTADRSTLLGLKAPNKCKTL